MINWNTFWSRIWLPHSPGQLKSPHWNKQDFPLGKPLTARQAWEMVRGCINKFDKKATLRSILAPSGVSPEGRAKAWEFGVDAPTRRAQGQFKWAMCQQEGVDRIECHVYPFPAIGSPQHILASSGQMPDKWLDACWASMREHARDIPEDFVDSVEALSSIENRGIALDGAGGLSISAMDLEARAMQWEVGVGEQVFKVPIEK